MSCGIPVAVVTTFRDARDRYWFIVEGTGNATLDGSHGHFKTDAHMAVILASRLRLAGYRANARNGRVTGPNVDVFDTSVEFITNMH